MSVGGEAPSTIQCSTAVGERPRLALKLFQGERDISGFDWPFTPIHGSSPSVFNRSGFGPPRVLPRFSLPMDSSPGFASAACDSIAILKALSLRLGSNLNLAAYRNSLAHSTKARRHPAQRLPTACRRTVSGTVSLPSRGAFHLSLTVLVRYRSQESVQPWRVVPPGSHRVSRARRYSGAALAVRADSRTGLSPCSAGLPRPFRFRADL